MTTKTCLVLGTGTAKPGVIEDGLADQPDDVGFLVAWHDKEMGDQASMRQVLQWLVKNQRHFEILASVGTKFPQPVIDAASDIFDWTMYEPLDSLVSDGSIDYALLAFSENGLNGRDYCEQALTTLIKHKFPVYELNNGCVPLTIVEDTPKAPAHPIVDGIDEGDALESASLEGATHTAVVEDVLIATLIFPGGNAIWRRVTHAEAERFFDLT